MSVATKVKTGDQRFVIYLYNSGEQTVRRLDAPGAEARKIADSIELRDDNAPDLLKAVSDGIKLEIAMGLNGVTVGVEEVSGLRDLLMTGIPLPPHIS